MKAENLQDESWCDVVQVGSRCSQLLAADCLAKSAIIHPIQNYKSQDSAAQWSVSRADSALFSHCTIQYTTARYSTV